MKKQKGEEVDEINVVSLFLSLLFGAGDGVEDHLGGESTAEIYLFVT